jgi:hypothetical protein
VLSHDDNREIFPEPNVARTFVEKIPFEMFTTVIDEWRIGHEEKSELFEIRSGHQRPGGNPDTVGRLSVYIF